MKITKIITKTQKLFLDLASKNKYITSNFYLSGDTALAGFYLPYRYSEDLDFFSLNEVDVMATTVFLKSIKGSLGYNSFDINTSYNRNLIFLQFSDQVLKLEFTYYPFPQIDQSNKYQKIIIDSVLDIAVNKLFTIYQKPRSRDFIDLYMIQKKYSYTTRDLIMKAKLKFDWHIDLIKLGSQFLLSSELKDYPNLREPLNPKTWQDHFYQQAKSLSSQIFKS
jgi:predicted nucleotidyltransferase component of viral defense system